ncbi:MAG: thermonuclease family protein [Caulobacteraceae bacterium]|nr:thermonuclease family protein [Caulobacteraceae bacterium]
MDDRRGGVRAGLAQAALLGLLSLTACGDAASDLSRLSSGEHGRVTAVRSGDVVALDSGLTVRLAGVEAPYEGAPGAAAARTDLAKRVSGRKVELLYGGARRDGRGRALAQLRLEDGTWVQGALLRDGVVEVRTYADNRAMAAAMLEDEARARIARRGLWGAGVFTVRLPREIGQGGRDGAQGFQIVEGRVIDVTRTARGTYLDFTSDHQGFAALVAAPAEPDFEAAGDPLPALKGQLIRLRGPVGWNQVMRIDHPEQVERLKAG